MVSYGKSLGVDVETFVSNYEGAILEFIHQSAERVDGYIINPAGRVPDLAEAAGPCRQHKRHELLCRVLSAR